MSLIKLHNAEDNSVILVKIDLISVVDTSEYEGKRVSEILLENYRETFLVNETPEKIYSMIVGETKPKVTKSNNDKIILG